MAATDKLTTKTLPLKDRIITVRPGMVVEFCYPPEDAGDRVPVLVDFKRFTGLMADEVRAAPFGWEKFKLRYEMFVRPDPDGRNDDHLHSEFVRHGKIKDAITKRGEMDMPIVNFSDGRASVLFGHHRFSVFKALGAERIMVMASRDQAKALEEAAGVVQAEIPSAVAAEEAAGEKLVKEVTGKLENFRATEEAKRRNPGGTTRRPF